MADRAASPCETRQNPTAEHTFAWRWGSVAVPVSYDVAGPAAAGPILLLPALSSVSTRDELRALAQGLPARRIVRADWPGFGGTGRPRLDYEPDLYRRFLEDLVAHLRAELGVERFPVVACGHAAGYAIDLTAANPGAFPRLVLIAPTWRGPLPTMMNGRRPVHGRIRRLIHAAVIGEALYRLNVSRPVVRMMYRRHVFADPARLTDDLLGERMRLTRQPGARSAAPSSSAPASEVILPPSNAATTRRRSTASYPNRSRLHSVGIGSLTGSVSGAEDRAVSGWGWRG